jgi:hypothetical protein
VSPNFTLSGVGGEARAWLTTVKTLKLQPDNAWSLYGRGLAKPRKGMKADGEADLAAATAVDPRMEDEAKKYDLSR